MNKYKNIGILLIILTILAGITFFSLAVIVGEGEIYDLGGTLLYMWMLYFAAIIAIISLIFALWAKKRGYKYKINVVVSLIAIPCYILLGSYGFIFSEFFDYSNQIILSVNEKTGSSIPENEKVVTQLWEDYHIGYIKISSEKTTFEESLNDKWKTTLSSSIKNVLPDLVETETYSYGYYLFYDCVSQKFNEVTVQEEGHSCVFLAYKPSSGRLIILNEYDYRA